MRFQDRRDAGEQLAKKIQVSDPSNTVVLALPRGGIPLGIVVSNVHSILLDVILAKKIGHPSHSEFAIGAVAEGGEPIFNQGISVDKEWIEEEVSRIRKEIDRRRNLYNKVLDQQTLANKNIIIIDDGIATGMTMFAAIEAAKKENPNSITVAVPVIPKDTYNKLLETVDKVNYVDVPDQFLGAVGAYYTSFPQLEDDKVQKMLKTNSTDI